MTRLKDVPIRKKLLWMILSINASSLFVALGGVLLYDVVAFREQARNHLLALADVIGYNCAAALAFEDAEDAKKVLAGLDANESIVGAWVLTARGDPLAAYARNGTRDVVPSPAIRDGCYLQEGVMSCLRPVLIEGSQVGTVLVQSDLRWAHRMVNRHLGIMGGVFVLSLGCVFFASLWVQRLISGPLIRLADLARSISTGRDYAARAIKEGDDETGRLVDAFNLMLEEIERRTQALDSARLQAETSAQEAHRLAEMTERANLNLREEVRIRKQIEHELRTYQERLEEMVRDRTAQLTEANECLSREIAERKGAEARLRASLEEKGTLLAEIHHRVRNNLQTISNLLSLTRRRTGNPEARQILAEARSRIYSMALVHERLYRSVDFNRVDMGSYILDLFQSIREIYRGSGRAVVPVIECEGVYLPVTQAISCALVLNEAITNVYKHAYGRGNAGPCHITMRQLEGNRILLRVKDEGRGIPGTIDMETADTLGIKLMTNLVRHQLGGRFRIERNGGTDIRIEFELKGAAGRPMKQGLDPEEEGPAACEPVSMGISEEASVPQSAAKAEEKTHGEDSDR